MNNITPFGINRRRPLKLIDIMDMSTEEFKDNPGPIYFNGIRIVWPPERTRVDEITFHLENGDQVERYYGEDINDETGLIEDMEIQLPNRDERSMGAGKKTKNGMKKTRKYSKKSRHYRKKSRRHRRH